MGSLYYSKLGYRTTAVAISRDVFLSVFNRGRVWKRGHASEPQRGVTRLHSLNADFAQAVVGGRDPFAPIKK